MGVVRSSMAGAVAARILASLAIVFAVTWLSLALIPPDPATTALLLLLVILPISTFWGYLPSISASIGAAIGFGYVLPPANSFRIDSAEDWFAFFVFLTTSFTASYLSGRARFREREAISLRRLAELLLGSGELSVQAVAASIPKAFVDAFELGGAAFHLRASGETWRAGPAVENLAAAALRGETEALPAPPQITQIAIASDSREIGVLTLAGGSSRFSSSSINSIRAMVALAIERSRLADEASRAESMRKRDELRATLLAAIAHDFRTPLTAIKGAATELLASTESRADAELLSILDEEADHMNRLLAEAIELGRVESESLHLRRIPTAVDELLEWARLEFGASGRIAVHMDPQAAAAAPSRAILDVEPERIRQVLRQLVGNALKYSPAGTTVLITAEIRESDAVLTVRDEGQGIPADEIDRIFDAQFRGRRAAATAPGDGMGLAIARSLVEAHGGRIWAESYPEQGSSFSFTAPLILPPASGEAKA